MVKITNNVLTLLRSMGEKNKIRLNLVFSFRIFFSSLILFECWIMFFFSFFFLSRIRSECLHSPSVSLVIYFAYVYF